MSSEYIIDESEPFAFDLSGKQYKAYVRYYSNGDMDVELEDDELSLAYDKAWEIAKSKNLLTQEEMERRFKLSN